VFNKYRWVDHEVSEYNKEGKVWSTRVYPGNEEHRLTDYHTYQHAVQTIKEHDFSTKALFMIVGFRKPHLKYVMVHAEHTRLVTSSFFDNLPKLQRVNTDPRSYTAVCEGLDRVRMYMKIDRSYLARILRIRYQRIHRTPVRSIRRSPGNTAGTTSAPSNP